MSIDMISQVLQELPPITRAYIGACIATTALVEFKIVSPLQLYLNPYLIWNKLQMWRIVTNFLYWGRFGIDFFLNVLFTYRFCSMLEEESFHGRKADFVVLLLFGISTMTLISSLPFMPFLLLGQAFTIMLVYVWARRNPMVRMNFFGLLTFQAPYLPWVLLGFSLLLGNSVSVDLLGMAVGHIYYFLEDVFPNQPGGKRLLATPTILRTLFDGEPEDPNYNPLPEERPGGFDWGAAGENAGANDIGDEQNRRQDENER